jgi:hypothetical protein
MDNLNKINGDKNLYDRICVWMADYEDPDARDEDRPMNKLEADAYLLEEAMTLFHDIYQTCNDK